MIKRVKKGKEMKLNRVGNSGLQIYGGPGSLSHDFKKCLGSGPSGPKKDPSFLVVKNLILIKKSIHLTASLPMPQNKKYM